MDSGEGIGSSCAPSVGGTLRVGTCGRNVGPTVCTMRSNLRRIAPISVSMWKFWSNGRFDVTIFFVKRGIVASEYRHRIVLSMSQSNRCISSSRSHVLKSMSSKTIPSWRSLRKFLSVSRVLTTRGLLNWWTAHCVLPVPVAPQM